MNTGILYIVATPIGNLKDITFRAVETLTNVDAVVCEDTRVTGNLLKHFGISKEMISFNAQTEIKKISYIIEKLHSGLNLALVSDAGSPCISDPGIRLVSEALSKDIKIVPIPGVNAAITALTIGGLPTDSFIFEGFLPQKKGRQTKLKELSKETRTVVLYESMYRIEKLLTELEQHMPDKYVVICRELTKMFEEYWSGYPSDLIKSLSTHNIKGEFVLLIGIKK